MRPGCQGFATGVPGDRRAVTTPEAAASTPLPPWAMSDDAANNAPGAADKNDAMESSGTGLSDEQSRSNSSLSAAEKEAKNKAKNEAKRAAKMEKFLAKQSKAETCSTKADAKAKTPAPRDKTEGEDAFVDDTPAGEKKDMTRPMAKDYNPQAVEAAWYAWWEKSGFFKPEYHGPLDGSRERFSIVMPPPNVTGSLHLGHATMLSIEDALCRWHRMRGKSVLYLPGCDHAGIATQAVVEKQLKKEQGITRHVLGRAKFLEQVWQWKDQFGHRIYDQMRRMGASPDWERAKFTLDPQLSRSVAEAFIRLFNEGLIFRENRLVNWCGQLKTSLSDLEVEMREIEGGAMLPAFGHDAGKRYKFGTMTHIAYKLEAGQGVDGEEIVIATTRPETVFADVAVCVNPTDERYRRFHGKRVIHPVLGHAIPVICDEAAHADFGTGALKISPAHDHTDFAVGKKHGLPFVCIYDENNILNEHCGSFAGMARYDAREAVVAFVRENGTFRGEESYPMSVPVCSRSGDFVEPRMIPQWWLNCQEMAAKSVEAVRSGELELIPRENEKIWFHWLENIRDWCLSRQLWWGHRIPAYLVKVGGAGSRCGGASSQSELWVAAHNEADALRLARERLPDVGADRISVHQDEDVLDTWFSSALWPFSTMGWPDLECPDMKHFFPNQLLETGSDILFFWVARMVMTSLHLTGQLPFKKVFLHAIVRDAHGRKMSKSLGNVIDPLDVIGGINLEQLQARLEMGNLDPREVQTAKEGQRRDFPSGIPECGTDALRFGLCSYISEGRDINMSIGRIEGYRRFCNKLWNATRFALMKLGEDYLPEGRATLVGGESMVDKWILSRLGAAIRETNEALECFNLMVATQAIYSFWLYELCDVYIEAIKPLCTPDYPDAKARQAATNTLYLCLEQGLRLLHPFMPFITEELYQRLPRRPDDKKPSICVSPYPEMDSSLYDHPEAEAAFEKMYGVIRAVRSLASDKKPAKNSTVSLCIADEKLCSLMRSQEEALGSLIRGIGSLTIRSPQEFQPSGTPDQVLVAVEDVAKLEFVAPK